MSDFEWRRFLANSGKLIVATSSNQLTLLNRFLPCLNRTCLLIASVPLQDSALSLHWRIQGKPASQPPDENRAQRTAKSRPLRASLAGLSSFSLSVRVGRRQRPNEKSWPASVRAHSGLLRLSRSFARSAPRWLCGAPLS